MAAEFTLGSETPIKEAAETFNVAFGGIQGVGKTTLYNKLKTGEFVEGGSSEQTDQGLDYVVLVKEVEDVTIKVVRCRSYVIFSEYMGLNFCRSQGHCMLYLSLTTDRI